MSKYAPLTRHLQRQPRQQIAMSFPELESLLGFSLPPSARKHRAWWSNNPSNSVMTQAWLDAGYQSRDVDLAAERLVFVKLNHVDRPPADSDDSGDHPLWGIFAGQVAVERNHDLAEPADLAWGDHESHWT